MALLSQTNDYSSPEHYLNKQIYTRVIHQNYPQTVAWTGFRKVE